MPASENLHSSGLMQRSKWSPYSISSSARAITCGASGITFGIPSWLGSGCGWSERHEDVQKQLKPPDGGVFLRLNGIVIKSHRGFGTEGFADAINLG